MNGYRQSPFANLTPVVKNLLIINLIFFLAKLLFDRNGNAPMTALFGCFYVDSPNFRPWQIITHMFMHANLGHILFNMFALFSFGPILEHFLGSKKFFTFYFICGLGAVALQMFVYGLEVRNLTGGFTISHPITDETYYLAAGNNAQKLFNLYNGPLVGASGAVVGLLAAFAMIYPNLELMFLFFPVPVKAKYIIPGYLVLEVFLGVGQFAGDNVAHFAHLGGALIGFIIIKAWGLKSPGTF